MEACEAIWASTRCRSWESARILAPGRPIHLEFDFREIDFGDWEGLTAEEIESLDPERYALWQERSFEFAFPGGETREAFRLRVARGLARLRATGVESALVTVHKGVVRTLLELITGTRLPASEPDLGGVVQASRTPTGEWQIRSGR